MRKTAFILSLICASVLSCGRITSDVAAEKYLSRDARFTLVLPRACENGVDVTLSCEKTGEKFSLSVLSPERSGSFRILSSPDGCSVTVDDAAVPLSPAVSAGLCEVFSAMYPESYTTSSDGGKTVLQGEYGEVIVGDTPEKIIVGEREITITDFEMIE